jgi:hypothetical protein
LHSFLLKYYPQTLVVFLELINCVSESFVILQKLLDVDTRVIDELSGVILFDVD